MWIHNGFVNVNKEKMSKSLGNFLVLRDLCERFDPMVLRYYYLTHHYRAPIEFSFEGIASAQKSYERLIRLFADSALAANDQVRSSSIATRMLEYLCDDMNTPGLLGVVFENIAELANNPEELSAAKTIFVDILGLTLEPLKEKKIIITAEIQDLIDARIKARQDKDWALADTLRDQLQELGVDVHDGKIEKN